MKAIESRYHKCLILKGKIGYRLDFRGGVYFFLVVFFGFGGLVMAKRVGKRGGGEVRLVGQREGVVFLPDCLDQVRAIASRGLTDDEMAEMFGISPKLIQRWKEFYPSFREAIEKGRTKADSKVVESLWQTATGLSVSGARARKRKQQVVKLKDADGGEYYEIVELEEDVLPEFQAQRYWLDNRQPEHWGTKLQIGGDRSPGAKPVGIGVRDETKEEVINSILNMITPKSD